MGHGGGQLWIASGISDRDLYRMRDEGDVERLARGIYARPGLGADPKYSYDEGPWSLQYSGHRVPRPSQIGKGNWSANR